MSLYGRFSRNWLSRLDFMNRLRRPEDRLAITLSPISCCDEPSRSPWSRCWAGLCSGGVLARHPKLRVAFLEANCTWLPWLLWRLDEGWEREGDVWAKDLTMAPSQYFKRQVFVSVEPDEAGVKYVIDYIGTDRLVFSTDYPHGDSKFPHAVESFLKLEITQDDKRKILWDNCAEFYHLH